MFLSEGGYIGGVDPFGFDDVVGLLELGLPVEELPRRLEDMFGLVRDSVSVGSVVDCFVEGLVAGREFLGDAAGFVRAGRALDRLRVLERNLVKMHDMDEVKGDMVVLGRLWDRGLRLVEVEQNVVSDNGGVVVHDVSGFDEGLGTVADRLAEAVDRLALVEGELVSVGNVEDVEDDDVEDVEPEVEVLDI